MEVDSIQLDHKDDCIGEALIENLTLPGSLSINNVFGVPLLTPRVGDKYQVDIPSTIAESERLELLAANPLDSQALNTSFAFLVGLPIPIMWACDDQNVTEDRGLGSRGKAKIRTEVVIALEARNGKIAQTFSRRKRSEHKAEYKRDESRSENFVGQLNKTRSYYGVPGLKTDQWSNAEVDIFLLGLYIFGKNFLQIRRFMVNKDLGTIQSFYYGKFYRSDAYRRWSRSRKKVRRKKCVTGRKIFTGWRQQELLSRLSSHVSEDSQKSLQEGYKSFTEGQTSFEEYVFLLKSIVGIPVLVEVIGIGNGKEDLTGIAMDSERTNHEFGPPHLPTGQDCSSLSSKEILNLLTGGFRLSKGRCSDIFWDAVWPRLLAKGWHSEQPKNQGYASSKNYLVFLMPGIKKFSRRKLAKGEHYFDSVSDVLNKVASEPKLIELESEESSVGGRKEQDGWSPEMNSDQEDQAGPQRRCYLKPRVSPSSSCQMKFTVVDTGLLYGGKSTSVRELRYLPPEFKLTSKMSNCLVKDEEDSSENNSEDFTRFEKPSSLHGEMASRQKGIADSSATNCLKFTVVDTSVVVGGKPSKMRELRCLPVVAKGVSESTDLTRSAVKDASEVAPNSKSKSMNSNPQDEIRGGSSKAQMAAENNCDLNTSVSGEKHENRTLLCQFRRRVKPGHSDSMPPVVKRRRLTACAKSKSSELAENETECHEAKNLPETDTNIVSVSTPKVEGSLDEDIKLKLLRRNYSAESSDSRAPAHGPLDSVVRETVTVKTEASEAMTSSVEGNTLQPSATVNRRQSTRNRPLTARALEALANGFLNVQKRSKNTGVFSVENPFSNPCRKARSTKFKMAPCHGDVVASGSVSALKEDIEADGGTCDEKSHRVGKGLGDVN